MSDWQDTVPVNGPPEAGPVDVGMACLDVPVGGQMRFTVADPPLDSGWREITNPNVTFLIQQDWPAHVDTTMTLYYQGDQPVPPDASITPEIAIPAQLGGPAASDPGGWQQAFPMKGPDGANDVQVGVEMFDIPPGSTVHFTLPGGGGVDPLDSGSHAVVNPNESYGLKQSWPNDYATTMTLSFAANGALSGDSALQPYLAQIVHHPKYDSIKMIWKERVTPQ